MSPIFGAGAPRLLGIHHVTAVTAEARANHAFYTGLLGMRLVKKTVNQDDTSAYHLFYADAVGSPGSDLTFFDWRAAREQRGHGAVSRTGLRVAGERSLAWWAERFRAAGVRHEGVVERDGRLTLDFEDPEGQRLSLVDDGGAGQAHPWGQSPVPAEHQIRGLGPVTLAVAKVEPTDRVLTGILGLERRREYRARGGPVQVYAMEGAGPGAELHVAAVPGLPRAVPGAGGVHHVALRTPDAEYEAWTRHLRESGLPSSGAIDRYYFRSLYVREPGGILFEIASDGPGFTADEPAEHLGERLALPPFLEPRRAEIEASLRPL